MTQQLITSISLTALLTFLLACSKNVTSLTHPGTAEFPDFISELPKHQVTQQDTATNHTHLSIGR